MFQEVRGGPWRSGEVPGGPYGSVRLKLLQFRLNDIYKSNYNMVEALVPKTRPEGQDEFEPRIFPDSKYLVCAGGSSSAFGLTSTYSSSIRRLHWRACHSGLTKRFED